VDTPSAYKDARYPPAIAGAGENSLNISQLDAQNSRYKTLADLLENPDAPMLNPPKILRVLVLPYKGDNNELFMTRYAYIEIEKAQWILTDINEK
jgi:conjugal transfer pilus assembly protein TraV